MIFNETCLRALKDGPPKTKKTKQTKDLETMDRRTRPLIVSKSLVCLFFFVLGSAGFKVRLAAGRGVQRCLLEVAVLLKKLKVLYLK